MLFVRIMSAVVPTLNIDVVHQWRTQELVFCFGGGGGGFKHFQLRTEDRENGDLGAVAP
jgi:hypothetical protein